MLNIKSATTASLCIVVNQCAYTVVSVAAVGWQLATMRYIQAPTDLITEHVALAGIISRHSLWL